MTTSKQYDFSLFMKVWVPMTASCMVTVITAFLWLQKYGEEHYYSTESGHALETRVIEVKADMDKVSSQNNDILLMLGRIEGKLEK